MSEISRFAEVQKIMHDSDFALSSAATNYTYYLTK